MTAVTSQTANARKSRTLGLAGGRVLTYLEAGDLGGSPVLALHGLGSSRLWVHPDDSIAARLGVHLISPDRPGIGGSDALPGRSLLDWAADAEQLADALGLERFAVLGWSAGGPHALACAVAMPARVTAVGLVSSAAPFTGSHLELKWRLIGLMARHAPRLMRGTFEKMASDARDAEAAMARSISDMPAADRRIAVQPQLRAALTEAAAEAFRQGGEGVWEDAVAVARSWGFALADVRQRVELWHGANDTTWRPPVGRYLERGLPHVNARWVQGEGHLLYLERWADILAGLRPADEQRA